MPSASDRVNITDHLQTLTGTRIVARLAGPSAIRGAISRWYQGEEEIEERPDLKAHLEIVSNSGDSMTLPAPNVHCVKQAFGALQYATILY